MCIGQSRETAPDWRTRPTGNRTGHREQDGSGLYPVTMNDLKILHNPRCSKSRQAVAAAEGQEAEIVQYLKEPLTRAELIDLLGILEDEPTLLVRRDATFKQLGLTDDDVATAEQVADVLAENPKLMERPVLIRGDRAIIGRPTERVQPFLQA